MSDPTSMSDPARATGVLRAVRLAPLAVMLLAGCTTQGTAPSDQPPAGAYASPAPYRPGMINIGPPGHPEYVPDPARRSGAGR